MMQLGNHLQNLEAEKQKLRTQVKRLCQENAWLRDELASAQKKLHECEQSNAAYAVEIELVFERAGFGLIAAHDKSAGCRQGDHFLPSFASGLGRHLIEVGRKDENHVHRRIGERVFNDAYPPPEGGLVLIDRHDFERDSGLLIGTCPAFYGVVGALTALALAVVDDNDAMRSKF